MRSIPPVRNMRGWCMLHRAMSTVPICVRLIRSRGPERAVRIFAEGKRAAEALHYAYQTEFGVDTRIARIFNTYGNGADLMDQRVVIKMVVAALQNRPLQVSGNGEQLRTFCWVGIWSTDWCV